jgi:hypothetical protein
MRRILKQYLSFPKFSGNGLDSEIGIRYQISISFVDKAGWSFPPLRALPNSVKIF